jgi:hypothetical protein
MRQPDPTPTEIAQRCAELRSTWTEEDYEGHATATTLPWSVPVVKAPPETGP